MTTPPTSTPWVPMWPNVAAAPSGANLAYVGDWVAGTYNDGDYVVKDGVAFVCVGGPTAVAPDASVWGLAPVAAGIGTSLPASPVDGQEYILVDSLLTPTYSWRFRYVASITDAYKWVYLGGSCPLLGPVGATSGFTAAMGYFTLSSGPSFTFPRDGNYLVRWGIFLQCGLGTPTPAYEIYGSVLVGAVRSVAAKVVILGTFQGAHVASEMPFNGIAAGASAVVQGSIQAGGSQANMGDGWMEIVPRRVA